jgi:hypothetical protein
VGTGVVDSDSGVIGSVGTIGVAGTPTRVGGSVGFGPGVRSARVGAVAGLPGPVGIGAVGAGFVGGGAYDGGDMSPPHDTTVGVMAMRTPATKHLLHVMTREQSRTSALASVLTTWWW